MWTTRPRTTSPSSNSAIRPVPYTSSIRSSAAQAPSFRGSPRLLRGSCFSMLPAPPVDVFGRGYYGSSRTYLAHFLRSFLETLNRRHHRLTGGFIRFLPATPLL